MGIMNRLVNSRLVDCSISCNGLVATGSGVFFSLEFYLPCLVCLYIYDSCAYSLDLLLRNSTKTTPDNWVSM